MHRLINAEELLDLMLSHLSLSRYDQKFFYNLQLQNVLPRKPITTNQAALFTKVVKKYNRQLALFKLDADQVAELPWTLKIIQSSPEYTHAHISIENDQLILRSPFRQAFVQDFRDKSVMIWDRENRYYHTEFGLYKLKAILNSVMKHYQDIKLCPAVQKIIDDISIYDEESCWDPTLTICNNNLYIFNLNESLASAIRNIELNTELSTLALLASYGIGVSESLKKELQKIYSIEDLTFAINRQAIHEVSDIAGLADKLKKIECEYALHATIHQSSETRDEYHKLLAQYVDFPIQSTNMRKFDYPAKQFKMSVILKPMSAYSFTSAGCFFAGKIINLVNSNPIEIK
jgi:hypothetical protein